MQSTEGIRASAGARLTDEVGAAWAEVDVTSDDVTDVDVAADVSALSDPAPQPTLSRPAHTSTALNRTVRFLPRVIAAH
jgi:hypothetical protein